MTPTTASPATLDFFCSDEDLFLAFVRILSGYPLPGNVFKDIDPYQHRPWNLPGDIWYYTECNEKTDSSFGHWKPKGEDCILYSNPSFTGWRATLEFYEDDAPHGRKKAWVMQKYWITWTELCAKNNKKEASSLCKVFLGDEEFPNCENIHKMDTSVTSNTESINPNQLVIADSSNNVANGSTSKSQISEDDKMVEFTVAGKLSDHHPERPSEMDYLSRGDFLELLDLDNPASPSSSSENSSCLTMSSDEYFDSGALLQDIERDINHDMIQRGAACKFSSLACFRSNRVVVHEGASGCLASSRETDPTARVNIKINGAMPGSSAPSRGSTEGDIKHSTGIPKNVCRFKGPSSSSQTKETVVNGQKKETVGRKKKIQKKYLCFFPF